MNYLVAFIVFLSGAVVMIFELVGSRLLAPLFGTTLIVWTSLIGVILGSLSLGYGLGGKLADKKCSLQILAYLLLIAAILIAVTLVIKAQVITLFSIQTLDLRLSTLYVAMALFALPSVFLGMITPYAIKLKLTTLTTAGATVGYLYALSTVGSIVGTFLGGFGLIPYLSIPQILFSLSGLLGLAAILTTRHYKSRLSFVVIYALVILIIKPFALEQSHLVNLDTAYHHVTIQDYQQPNGRWLRMMQINNETSAAMWLDSNELALAHTRYFRLAEHFKPKVNAALMLGGAAYSYPQYYLRRFPQATLDVVEIDPALTELAQHYFKLALPNPRLTVFHEDGRTFLNRTQNQYDVIFVDVSHCFFIPHHLTTQEALLNMYRILTADGIVLFNLGSALEGQKGQYFRAQYATFNSVFPQVYGFPIQHPDHPQSVQNIMLLALKSRHLPLFSSDDPQLNQYLKQVWTSKINLDMPILTDDFAPVERYLREALQSK